MRPTLYEYAGGEPAFLALATAHHARCLRDPELNHPFSHPGGHPQHVQRLAAYWAEVLGGPPAFSQSCGDHSAVLHLHAGNGDMGDLGRRFVACFVEAMDDAGLPSGEEFRAALRTYMQWAVDETLLYGSPDVAVPAGLALPLWSWDGMVPDSAREDVVGVDDRVGVALLGQEPLPVGGVLLVDGVAADDGVEVRAASVGLGP